MLMYSATLHQVAATLLLLWQPTSRQQLAQESRARGAAWHSSNSAHTSDYETLWYACCSAAACLVAMSTSQGALSYASQDLARSLPVPQGWLVAV
jgi:hypothetical protein